jgi:hypothetical protein
MRSPQRGLLLLYPLIPIAIDEAKKEHVIADGLAIIGFGISFPGSENAQEIEYVVNNRYWEQLG